MVKTQNLKFKTQRFKKAWINSNLFPLISLTAVLFALIVLTVSWDKAGKSFNSEPNSCGTKGFSYLFDPKESRAFFEGKQLDAITSIPTFLSDSNRKQVLGVKSDGERWVEVDLSDQKLIAWEGNEIFLETAVSTGLPGTPTPVGEFRVWYKTKSQKMSGGEGRSYYYLPNVPYIMFFENSDVIGYRGYSLHGTYWHNDFGNVRSHGCVNLPIPIAEQLYYWTTPNLTEGTNIVRSSADNPGTRIVIHE